MLRAPCREPLNTLDAGLRQFAYLDLVFNTFLIDDSFYAPVMTRFSQDAPAAENAVEKEMERNRGVCLATR